MKFEERRFAPAAPRQAVGLVMGSVADGDDALTLDYGDVKIDAACMFAHRNGRTIQFTRSERALLLVLTGNPRRLLTRGRLLDEIATRTSDPSDRNIDFLVNRLRSKLGDKAKSPRFIATQYGEGYIWIATPLADAPLDAFLVVGANPDLEHLPFHRQASQMVERLAEAISAGIGPARKVAISGRDTVHDKARYHLNLSFHADHARLSCTAALCEMPSRRIVKTFRLQLDSADDASFAGEASRVSDGVVDALKRALKEVSSGLGMPEDEPIEARFRSASKLISAANPQWLEKGGQLARNRAQNPDDADAAIQWCLHLFSRLVLAEPFTGTSLAERDGIESEIETTVLQWVPAIEDQPLLMLAAAKLLYFINRGHLDLAESIAERACALLQDRTAGLPILGQVHYARGHYDEAVKLFDEGIAKATSSSEFHYHLRVLKCIALIAEGQSGQSAARSTDIGNLSPASSREIGLMVEWIIAAPDGALPPESEQALGELGPRRAAKALEYLYFTSARHLMSVRGRANVMRSMTAHVSRLYGMSVIPDVVLRGTEAAVPR
jgi:DNA-binding winged helix-turn-helix (wHTH) protein/tetratricopeptide (TPR) repeat protein